MKSIEQVHRFTDIVSAKTVTVSILNFEWLAIVLAKKILWLDEYAIFLGLMRIIDKRREIGVVISLKTFVSNQVGNNLPIPQGLFSEITMYGGGVKDSFGLLQK